MDSWAARVSVESCRTLRVSLYVASRVGSLCSSSLWTSTRTRDPLNAQAPLQGTWGILKLVLIFSQINTAACAPSFCSMAEDLDRRRKQEAKVKFMGMKNSFLPVMGDLKAPAPSWSKSPH